MKNANDDLARIRTSILIMGDLRGGFHLLKLATWYEIATSVCTKRWKIYLPQIKTELLAAHKRRKELMNP